MNSETKSSSPIGGIRSWNLVIIIVDGQTFVDLKDQDENPAFPEFTHILDLVSRVGQANVCFAFSSVSERDHQNKIDSWLRNRNFFLVTKIGFRQLLYMPDTEHSKIAGIACDHFCDTSYAHTFLLSVDLQILRAFERELEYTTRVLFSADMIAPHIDSIENKHPIICVRGWDELKSQLNELLKRRL